MHWDSFGRIFEVIENVAGNPLETCEEYIQHSRGLLFSCVCLLSLLQS